MLKILRSIFKSNHQSKTDLIQADEDNSFASYMKKHLPDENSSKQVFSNATSNYHFDPIDTDIYNCFIAYQYDFSQNSGTLTKFHKIEDRISNLCSAKGGKYYRSPAKSAKFAIIYNSKDITYNSIKGLMDEGYKVTSFENALKYFKLDHLWDVKSQNILK